MQQEMQGINKYALQESGILSSSQFQQDGDPAHTAQVNHAFLTETFSVARLSRFHGQLALHTCLRVIMPCGAC